MKHPAVIVLASILALVCFSVVFVEVQKTGIFSNLIWTKEVVPKVTTTHNLTTEELLEIQKQRKEKKIDTTTQYIKAETVKSAEKATATTTKTNFFEGGNYSLGDLLLFGFLTLLFGIAIGVLIGASLKLSEKTPHVVPQQETQDPPKKSQKTTTTKKTKPETETVNRETRKV